MDQFFGTSCPKCGCADFACLECANKEIERLKLRVANLEMAESVLDDIRDTLSELPCPCDKDHESTPPMFFPEWICSIYAGLHKQYEEHRARADAAEKEVTRASNAFFKTQAEVCNDLGKALGYPRFVDDQEAFPGATEADGVCVGEHVAESLAAEAARKIEKQARCLEIAEKTLEYLSRPVHVCECGKPEMQSTVRIALDALEEIKKVKESK